MVLHVQKLKAYLPWTPLKITVTSEDKSDPTATATRLAGTTQKVAQYVISYVDGNGVSQDQTLMSGSSGICMECGYVNINNPTNICTKCSASMIPEHGFDWYAEGV